MPLTWDLSGPGIAATHQHPSSGSSAHLPAASSSGHIPISTPEVMDQAAAFEPAEFDAEGVRTILTSSPYDLRPRFTGRGPALDQLAQLAERAFTARELGFAVVIGEPGMGKSRLLQELAARTRAEHPTTRLFHGVADEHARAYGPVARALTARFGLGTGEEPDALRAKLVDELTEIVGADRATELAHLIAHLLRIPFADSPVVTPLIGAPQRLEARLFMALKRLIAAECERYPMLIVIENLEQCGTDTINFLHYLAAGLRDHRVVIIGTATAALAERHPSFGEGEVAPVRIELGPLAPAEAEDLLRELCKQLPAVPAALSAHVRTMPGSPRAIYELVRLLLETQCIVRDPAGWRIDDGALATLRLPRTYDDLVAARLTVMEPLERRILEMAAAIGDTSWLDAVLALERCAQVNVDPDGPSLAQIAGSGDHSRQAVVTAIGRLVEHGWLVEIPQASLAGERELRFANAPLWDLVYQGIAESARRTYHGAFARWLELHAEGRTPTVQEQVAHHLTLAGEPREAAARYRRAAVAARDAFANARAIELFDRALDCLGAHDLPARIGLWHSLGSVYERIGNFDAALGAYERMLRLSWVAASKLTAAAAFGKMGRVWRRKGDVKVALEYLQRALELYRGANDAAGIAGALDDIGRTLHMLGRYDEAEAQLTDALGRHTKAGELRATATSLSRLGLLHQDRGRYDAAESCHRQAMDLRVSLGDRWGEIVARNNLAALQLELGELADARAGWLAALPAAEAMGALPLSALILTNLGELALADNKLDEARTRLENALEIIDDVADLGLESVCTRQLALVERLQGNAIAARELAERALAVAQRAGLREHEALAYMALGEVLSASIHDDEATDADAQSPAAVAFTAALEALGGLGHDAVMAKALFVFGRYKAETGDHATAKDMLRDALMMFSKLGLERRASEVEKLLASMN